MPGAAGFAGLLLHLYAVFQCELHQPTCAWPTPLPCCQVFDTIEILYTSVALVVGPPCDLTKRVWQGVDWDRPQSGVGQYTPAE
jgi:hypothetical protein